MFSVELSIIWHMTCDQEKTQRAIQLLRSIQCGAALKMVTKRRFVLPMVDIVSCSSLPLIARDTASSCALTNGEPTFHLLIDGQSCLPTFV